MTRVRLQYFAALREHAGRSEEVLESSAATLADLYEELRLRHGFVLDASRIRAAVSERYVPLETPLTENMQITFIPPVAGG